MKRRVHSIVIHHSAGLQTDTAESINRRHLLRGWLGIGYHRVVRKNASTGLWEVQAGRDIEKKGAHAGRGFPGNLGSVGYVVCGHYVETEPPKEALVALYKDIRALVREVGALYVWGHCDLNATACPGQKLYNWIPLLRYGIVGGVDPANLFDAWGSQSDRALAVDRGVARQAFRDNKQWAKGKGERHGAGTD